MFGWFKKKVVEPIDNGAADVGMIANDFIIAGKAEWDEVMKADHFRAEHLARFLREVAEGIAEASERDIKLLTAEMKMLYAIVDYKNIKKELEL